MLPVVFSIRVSSLEEALQITSPVEPVMSMLSKVKPLGISLFPVDEWMDREE